jgi:hypothetical protein
MASSRTSGGTTATGRLRAAKAARQSAPQQQQQQTKKGRRTSAGLQVTPAIKKNNQQPTRKAKVPPSPNHSAYGIEQVTVTVMMILLTQ